MNTCKVEPLKANSLIQGWRIIFPSGSIMFATTKREADGIANLVNEELTFLTQKHEAELKTVAIASRTLGINSASIFCCDRCEANKRKGEQNGIS